MPRPPEFIQREAARGAEGDAIVMCLRLRLDVCAQYAAGEEVRRLQEEVARLAALLPRGRVGVPGR